MGSTLHMLGSIADAPSVALLLLIPLAALGLLCLRRVAADRRRQGEVGAAGAWMIWVVYLTYTGLAAWFAWHGVWALALPEWLVWMVGGGALAMGLALLAGGAWEFGSLARMSGRTNGGLIRSGVYGWTRNPQNLGWGAALLGVALLGRSGAAIAMAVFFLVAFRVYAPVEERYLARIYGAEWDRYQAETHRFLGWPTWARGGCPARGDSRSEPSSGGYSTL